VKVYSYNNSYLGDRDRRIGVKGQWGQKYKTLSEKETKSKRDWGMAQVVECLRSKCKAPIQLPAPPPKEQRKKEKGEEINIV
jgi:hypothetical protein